MPTKYELYIILALWTRGQIDALDLYLITAVCVNCNRDCIVLKTVLIYMYQYNMDIFGIETFYYICKGQHVNKMVLNSSEKTLHRGPKTL